MSPRRRNLLIAAAAIVAVGGIASAVNGSSDSTGQTAAVSPTPSSPTAQQTSPTTADTPTATGSLPFNATTPSGSSGSASSSTGSAAPVSTIPSPDAAQTTDLLKRLGVISPVLARDEDKAVRRARNQCQDIVAGEPAEKLLSNAAYRFTTTGLETISTEQAQQILDAIEASFCPAP